MANPLLLTDLYNEWRDKKLNKGSLRITISGGGPVPPRPQNASTRKG